MSTHKSTGHPHDDVLPRYLERPPQNPLIAVALFEFRGGQALVACVMRHLQPDENLSTQDKDCQ